MDSLERKKRLLAMLQQVAPQNTLEKIPRPQPSNLEVMSAEHAAVETAIGKLVDNRPDQISEREQYALEAIVLPKSRPVVFVEGDSVYDDIPEPWESLNSATMKAKIGRLLPAIGRI